MERGLIVSAAVVFGACIAMPQAAAAQREPTTSTRTAVLNDVSCAVKVYVKNTAGGDEEIIQNGSTIWSSLRPPRVYALVFVYNKGPRHVTVYTWALLHKTVIDRNPLNMADFGKGEFVNSFGQPLPAEALYVLETIDMQGSKVLGPYWINSESRTTRFYIQAETDAKNSVNDSDGINNRCSRTFRIIAPPR